MRHRLLFIIYAKTRPGNGQQQQQQRQRCRSGVGVNGGAAQTERGNKSNNSNNINNNLSSHASQQILSCGIEYRKQAKQLRQEQQQQQPRQQQQQQKLLRRLLQKGRRLLRPHWHPATCNVLLVAAGNGRCRCCCCHCRVEWHKPNKWKLFKVYFGLWP